MKGVVSLYVLSLDEKDDLHNPENLILNEVSLLYHYLAIPHIF